MTDTTARLTLWIPQVVGRYLNEDWNPTNQGFGAQCWDVAASWSKYLGLPVISTANTAARKGRWPGWAGNMVDVFPQSAAIAAAYELIGPDAPGLPGDIAVWGDSNPFYPKTHVAVLVKDMAGLLLCISQNSSASLPGNPYPEWTTGPTIAQHLPRRGLLGFIRPRTGLTYQGTTTPPQEDDMFTDADRANQIEIRDNLRKLVNDDVEDDAFAGGMNEKLDEIVGNARKTFWNTEESKILLANTPAPQLAAQIDAAGIAADVRDELIKLLGGAA